MVRSMQLTDEIGVLGIAKSKPSFSERAKGAEKASCGETVVQKGGFGESVVFSVPLLFAVATFGNLRIHS